MTNPKEIARIEERWRFALGTWMEDEVTPRDAEVFTELLASRGLCVVDLTALDDAREEYKELQTSYSKAHRLWSKDTAEIQRLTATLERREPNMRVSIEDVERILHTHAHRMGATLVERATTIKIVLDQVRALRAPDAATDRRDA